MGKKGKKAQAGKPKKLTPKDIGKRLDVLAKNLEEELEGADLFAPLPPTEDCAICLVRLSHEKCEIRYMACCGNYICLACTIEHKEAIQKQNEDNADKKAAFTCPFCREPEPTNMGYVRQLQARCLKNDHQAFFLLGEYYLTGKYDETPKDDLKALDYSIRAVELGSPEACTSIGISYDLGEAVAVDKKRATLFERAGAARGCFGARHNIGVTEYYRLGNHEIAIRHWKIAAEAGHQLSLNALRKIYNADGKKPGKEFSLARSAWIAFIDSVMMLKRRSRARRGISTTKKYATVRKVRTKSRKEKGECHSVTHTCVLGRDEADAKILECCQLAGVLGSR